MNILIPKETKKNETRVAATPETVKKITELKLKVFIEDGAGELSQHSNQEYQLAGAKVSKNLKTVFSRADIIVKVNPPTKRELNSAKKGATFISSLIPQTESDIIKLASKNKIKLYSMNLIPRISRAQKMDSLTSQSNIAGYKAVIMAANALPKLFPLLMTAAGTIHPAKVVILGAGVAGLQAIATARRLGAQVEASDIRPAVKEQVESLGAKFIEVEFEDNTEDKNGYAKGPSKEFLRKQAEEVKKRIKQADVVITTALIPGRRAPVLITEDMVMTMKNGSVIVDMAVEAGGNCAVSKLNKTITKHGVTIIGEANIPATVAIHSTEMYSKNILNFLTEFINNKDDEVITKSEVKE